MYKKNLKYDVFALQPFYNRRMRFVAHMLFFVIVYPCSSIHWTKTNKSASGVVAKKNKK